jgi:hypothetical protein
MLTILVARIEIAGELARDGQSTELSEQLAAMAASAERLTASICTAREQLDTKMA